MAKRSRKTPKPPSPPAQRIKKVWDNAKQRQRILWDTGALLAALDPDASNGKGGLTQPLSGKGKLGVKIGFSDDVKHPEGTLSIAALAAIHHNGVPENNLPARLIFVQPDSRTMAQLTRAVDIFVAQLLESES
jgi:hypothetical protein